MKCLKKVVNKMYVKSFIKVLIIPFFFFIFNYLLLFVFNLIYINTDYHKSSYSYDEYFNNYINTVDFNNKLNTFLDNQILIITLITLIVFIPIIIKNYKKYYHKQNLKIKDVLLLMIIGIVLSLIVNTLLVNNVKISFLKIITTSIIGPILEEFIYRGILYNKLKEFNSNRTSIIISSVIFGLIHINPIKIIYTFILGIILAKIYEMKKTLKAPIITHISFNLTAILVMLFT